MAAFQFSRRNKFGAKRTSDGFPSQLEKAVYIKLKDQEILGLISDIKRQQTIVLQEGAREVRITWRIDFTFINKNTGQVEAAEAKGIETSDFKLKLKMWRANPPMALTIYKGNWRNPKIAERIETKNSPGGL